jgi:hypothetical protein
MKRNFSFTLNAHEERGDGISLLQFSLSFAISTELIVEFLCGDTLQRLSQRHECDLLRISRMVNEIAFDRIAVVCADRRQCAFLPNAMVKFSLPSNTRRSTISDQRRNSSAA